VKEDAQLEAIRAVLDRRPNLYRQLGRANDYGEYLTSTHADDEEILTEPVLADLLQAVLGFPPDGYFAQLSKSGLKPDFTPVDLVAHRFVLDAKSSNITVLDDHEPQIRSYVDQRRLDFGILFNLREVRVYRRGGIGADPELSFRLEPVWRAARGEGFPLGEVERFRRFATQFSHQALDTNQRITRIRQATSWRQLEATGETAIIDVEYLVDRLRDLSAVLAEDAAAQQEQLDRSARFNPGLAPAIVAELGTLANEIEPGANPDSLPKDLVGFRDGAGLVRRVWRQYLLRVSQLALTRILLYRSWEDSGFVDEKLYDGGFGVVYERLGRELSAVLAEAFDTGRGRYPWLYGAASTYDWYRPRDEALVAVLYTLLPVPLGKLDADVLGGLYESYVDEIDRDRLGQFYTPRSVVRFMLDRAGATGADGLFHLEGDVRRPRRVLDFATGSGGFLVEAARRIVDVVDDGNASDIDDGLDAIVSGLHGCEISPFPYYLTEVNLLLQVSRLLGRLRTLGAPQPPAFTLGVVHRDTLEARTQGIFPLADEPAALVHDPRFGLAPLDDAKSAAFERISAAGTFDLVVGNPPYVFEANNRAVFQRLSQLPGWAHVQRGKSDYLYYFLWLASEQVAEGGRIAVITPAGWMNAGDAGWLRDRIASHLRLDEMFLFGATRLFAPEHDDARDPRRAQAPTVESLILIATKAPVPPRHHVRVVVLENERAFARALTGKADARRAEREPLLATMAARLLGPASRRDGILVHSVRQSALRRDEPWPVKFNARDLATRVVRHLDALSEALVVERLDRRWHLFRGIETGADSFSNRVQKQARKVDPDGVERLLASGARTGYPIMELPRVRATGPPWSDHPELLAHSVEAHGILYGAVDASDDAYLVWIGRDDVVPASIERALEPWKPVLASRAEFVRNVKRRWFETAWPRDKEQMRAPKVIALYRTDRGRFAMDDAGACQPSNKATICTAREDGMSVAYLTGLLNSELLDLFYAVRGKNPRDVWRNYEPKPMARIPYRHIAQLETDHPAIDALRSADHLVLECDALLAERRDPNVLAAALEIVVRAIADNRSVLLPHRPVAPELRATIKDPWSTLAPSLDESALIAELPSAATVSVRIDPALDLTTTGKGRLGRPELESGALRYRFSRAVTATVTGPEDRLELLARVTASRRSSLAEDLAHVVLPKDLPTFAATLAHRARAIDHLLEEGRQMVERAERLVCRLYEVPAELEDEVVASAVARADRRRPDEHE
jgi:hypothetical protein